MVLTGHTHIYIYMCPVSTTIDSTPHVVLSCYKAIVEKTVLEGSWHWLYPDIYEEPFSKTCSAPIQKLRLQWQCKIRRSCFGKEHFINVHLYAFIHMWKALNQTWHCHCKVTFWNRVLEKSSSYIDIHFYIYIYIYIYLFELCTLPTFKSPG